MSGRSTPCPTCQRKVEWSAASPFRPFCSDRCRLIDLGAWVSEQRAIPGEEPLAGIADIDASSDPDHDPGRGGNH